MLRLRSASAQSAARSIARQSTRSYASTRDGKGPLAPAQGERLNRYSHLITSDKTQGASQVSLHSRDLARQDEGERC